MSQAKDNDTIETGKSRVQFWGGAVIVLMIVLMFMPWNINNRTRSGQESVLRGTASGGRKVMSAETESAAAALETLEGLRVTISDPRSPQGGYDVPLLTALWGSELATEMKRHPEAYFLLVQESRKFGLGDNPRTLGPLNRDLQNAKSEGIFNSGFVYVRELHPLFGGPLYDASHLATGGSQVATQVFVPQMQNDGYVSRLSLAALPPIRQEALHAALKDLLSVQAVASLASTAVKPSTVLIDQLIARQGQNYTLQVAGIDAQPLVDAVTVPTDAELQAHLAKYANTPAGSVTAENPFGFGYQVQNAVKLQMLVLNRSEVRTVVQAEKSAYDWEVEARMAYAKDPKQFRSLAPTTAPTTTPTTTPSTAPAEGLEEAVSFDQIKSGAVNKMIDQATAARVDEIARKIRSTMTLDYQSWVTAKNTNTTTQPSSLGVNYDSVEYLNKLAAAIQAEPRFKVLPSVYSEQSKFLDAEALSQNEVLSGMTYTFEANAAAALGIRQAPIPAAAYIIEFARPFMKKTMIEKAGGSLLDVLKASDPLVDELENKIAFIRITDTAAAHAATNLESLRGKLIADVKRVNAQAKALEKAQAAVQAIKSSGKFEVPGAPVATVYVESAQNRKGIPPELGLNGQSYAQFYIEVGRKLLAEPNGTPVEAISVPLAQKVFVAQRIGLTPSWADTAQLDQLRVEILNAINSSMAEPSGYGNQFGLADKAVANTWVDVEAVLARNEWKSAHPDRDHNEP
jgi:hypothetical protein